MTTFNDARVHHANDRPVNRDGRYVLLWLQMARRLRANHALDYARHWATQLKKPLVVYEGLKLRYPWASARFHKYILEGMRDNAAEAAALGLTYWPFVETPDDPGRGLVRRLCEPACLLVTDDYPQFIVPAQIRAVAAKADVAVHAVDTNSMVPLDKLGPTVSAAAHLRPRIHKLFGEAWGQRAATAFDVPKPLRTAVEPPFAVWTPPADIGGFVRSLPIDQSVPPFAWAEGGSAAGRRQLAEFVRHKLPQYADGRSQPDDPTRSAASGLSWALHYGHLGVQEVCEAVLGPDWTPAELNLNTRNKDDFFARDANVNSYLDELITWRDVGYHWNYRKNLAVPPGGPTVSTHGPNAGGPAFNFASYDFSPLGPDGTLAGVLPDWARATLGKHAADRREHLYTRDQFEHADTHDELWNAAHRQLVATGRIHNYLRMLWGKKVLEWSETPEEGYRTLEHLNNKYAYDGRDPNSYTGILWVFGLFDRPWPPERDVYGSIRYMSSPRAAEKFDLNGYYRFVRMLPTVAEVRRGGVAGGGVSA